MDRIGKPAIQLLTKLLTSKGSSPRQRSHALWALERLDGFEPPLVHTLARDADRDVRVHLMKMLAERQWDESPLVRAALNDPDAFVRRSAADALGRHPRIEHVKPLLDLWAATPSDDTHLIHVTRMALRDQLLKSGMYAELSQTIGTDQTYLDRLANVSLGVPNQDSAAFVWRQLQAHPAGATRDAHLGHVARHIEADRLSEVYAYALELRSLSNAEQIGVVRALGRANGARGGKLPADVTAWAGRLVSELLASDQEGQVQTGIELSREFNPPVFASLALIARPQGKFDALRPAAIDACVANDAHQAIPLLAEILGNAAEPMKLRQQSATALARINDDSSRQHLLTNLQTAPERLAIEIASALSDSAPGAEVLLATVTAGKASARLLQENAVLARLRARKLEGLDERLAKLTAGLPPQDQRIRQLIDQRRKLVSAGQPDLAQGAAVFEKNCAICHRIGDKGAKIGPNLDGAGIRGVDRLLEDILDPNRNVDQAFRTTQIVSTDGRILSGLALREEGRVLVLADPQGKEVRIPQEEIEQRAVSSLSLMPANVPDLISEADFVHLLGYLLSQREAAPSAK
jgi:putative heme-binding domain-containing protein